MKSFLFLFLSFIIFSCGKKAETKWNSWTVNDTPVFSGQFSLTGDPCIIKDNRIYRMFYTGFDAYRTPQGPEICQATSSDGITWNNVPVNDNIEGRMLYTASNTWSNAHETSFAIKFNNAYYLYFIGYNDKGGFFNSSPTGLGLVTSADGENFIATQSTPIMVSTINGLDRSAFSSPSITTYQGSLVMIYTGYCYIDCGKPVTANLLAARSADGINWTKKNEPVINTNVIPWASEGAAEPEIVLGPDQQYYLFMTSVDQPHVIGVAKSNTPFGPWDVNPQPIVKANKTFSQKGALAPAVIIEGNRVRLWYSGFTSTQIQIGYAETAWPLKK